VHMGRYAENHSALPSNKDQSSSTKQAPEEASDSYLVVRMKSRSMSPTATQESRVAVGQLVSQSTSNTLAIC